MNTIDSLHHNIFHACEHLAGLGEHIDNTTLSIKLSDNITINIKLDTPYRTTVFFNTNIVFDAAESFDGGLEITTFEDGCWHKTITSEFDAITNRLKHA